MVVPSSAVTTTLMVLEPTFRVIELEAEPLATVAPLTFTEATDAVSVGVTVIEVVAFVTDAV